MARGRRSNRRSAVQVMSPHEKLRRKDYVHKDRRPGPEDTYVTDGTEHRYDGRCHTECPNVR